MLQRSPLTPVDVLNLRFRRGLRGYATGEVDEFLRRVAADLETALADNAVQRERIDGLERELAQYRTLEATMRDALVLAQRAAEETRSAARAQADALIESAVTQARDLEVQTQIRLSESDRQIECLHQERRRLARDFRAQLTSQLAWLDETQAALQTSNPSHSLSNSSVKTLPLSNGTATPEVLAEQPVRAETESVLDANTPVERPAVLGLPRYAAPEIRAETP